MGYYINLNDALFVIPEQNLAEAWRRFQLMNAPEMDFAKSGGSYSGGGKQEAWYSWMPSDYDKSMSSAKEVFEALGFQTETGSRGFTTSQGPVDTDGLWLTRYDSKTGQEDLFLYVIRDLVEPGSYLRFQGEDGAMYEYSFDGVDMLYRQGGWAISAPVPLEARVFKYTWSDELHVDLVPRGTPRRPGDVEVSIATPLLAGG